MSGRLKFILAVLAVGAGLSFWYAIELSTGRARDDSTASILNNVGADTRCDDQDADGLCDYEETYWSTDFKNPDSDGDGYTDGEEVLSGHDPAKAGPDDNIGGKENLTQKASRLLLGALLTGDMSVESANYEASIQKLADLVFEQYDANTTVELDSIALASDSASAITAYTSVMTGMLRQLMPEIEANERAFLETIRDIQVEDLPKLDKLNPKAYTAYIEAADNEIAAFDQRVAAVKSVRVPPALNDFHRTLLQYLRGLQQHYRLARTITTDPVQGLLSLQVAHTLATQTSAEIIDTYTRAVISALP